MGSLKSGIELAADGSVKLANGANRKMVVKHCTNLNTLARSSLAFSDRCDYSSAGVWQPIQMVLVSGKWSQSNGYGQPNLVSGVNRLNNGFGTFSTGLMTRYWSGSVGNLNQMAVKPSIWPQGVGQLLTSGMGTLNDEC